jgi:hypothetical protein
MQGRRMRDIRRVCFITGLEAQSKLVQFSDAFFGQRGKDTD